MNATVGVWLEMTVKNKGVEDKTESGLSFFESSVYSTLPIDNAGAPEFIFRKFRKPEEQKVLLLENASRSILCSPWCYPVTLFAERIITDFPKLFTEGKDSYGDVEFYFPNEDLLKAAVITHLIHLRAPQTGLKLKVIIPQTTALLKVQETLKERLGRVREPFECMRLLVIKNVPQDLGISEVQKCFPHHGAVEVSFNYDALDQRCAVVKFGSAELAIAAHMTTGFVKFDTGSGNTKSYKVLYAYVQMNHWGKRLMDDPQNPLGLLTVNEMKEYVKAHKDKAVANGD